MNQTGTHGTDRIDPTIGERLMVIRRRRGMSQRKLAIRAAMSPTTLNRLERGLQCITAERLAILARLLDVSSDYLLGLSLTEQQLELCVDAPHARRARPDRHAAPVG